MWKSDEITLSLRRPLGVTPSHDLGVFSLRFAYFRRPCYIHLLLIETFGRHLKDSHTTRHAEPTAEEQG